MAHPAFADNYCEKHEKSHQEDICPLCWHEDEESAMDQDGEA
jgi:hypothetical protein